MADGSTPVPQIALPSQSEPIIDRYRRWTPNWWKWIKPLLEVTNDNSKKLAAQATNIDTINAAIEQEQTVRADEDAALASQIDTISANYQSADDLLEASFTSQIQSEQTARASADGALTTRIDNIESDYQAADFTLQSNISSEATARASADGGLSDRIDTVETNYQTADSTLNAAITSEASARVAGDGVNATNISTVTSQVNDLTTTVTEQTISINGVQAKWGVNVNNNGRVTGLELNSGLDNLTTFAILADHFVIVHPTANGTTIQAFIAGLVNGIASVGINGNLIVDDTITADKIVATTLSAITANLGTVTAGLIQNPAGTLKFDLPNMRLYRTDGKFDLNASANTFVMKP